MRAWAPWMSARVTAGKATAPLYGRLLLRTHRQHNFPHRSRFQPLECLRKLLEREDLVHQRPCPGAAEEIEPRPPRRLAFGGGVGADVDAADAQSAEEQARGVEAGDGAGEAADAAHPAAVAERF